MFLESDEIRNTCCTKLFHHKFKMAEENQDLQRKIVKALNEEIGSDLKQLHKLKELFDETKVIQNDLREKVSLAGINFYSRHLIVLVCCFSCPWSVQRHQLRCKVL